jgi:hypothetical protein
MGLKVGEIDWRDLEALVLFLHDLDTVARSSTFGGSFYGNLILSFDLEYYFFPLKD